jgi:hypothetical protein
MGTYFIDIISNYKKMDRMSLSCPDYDRLQDSRVLEYNTETVYFKVELILWADGFEQTNSGFFYLVLN